MPTATRPSYAPGLRNAGPDAQGHVSLDCTPDTSRSFGAAACDFGMNVVLLVVVVVAVLALVVMVVAMVIIVVMVVIAAVVVLCAVRASSRK